MHMTDDTTTQHGGQAGKRSNTAAAGDEPLRSTPTDDDVDADTSELADRGSGMSADVSLSDAVERRDTPIDDDMDADRSEE